jgi:N-methylhydantoinase B/oxoprolinase/acetone carboxylase alpha subunit
MERNMEATLQVIMEQLKEISAGQSELMSDICAEVKSDMNRTVADLITQMHAIKSKMSNCISVIREELQMQICDLCAGQAELEERLDKQQKDVNSMVEQKTRDLREDIKGTRRDFEAKLAAVETRTRRAVQGLTPLQRSHSNSTVQHPGQCFTDSLSHWQSRIIGNRMRKLHNF